MILLMFIEKGLAPRPVLHRSRDKAVTVTSRPKMSYGTPARPCRIGPPVSQSRCRPGTRGSEPLRRRDGEAETHWRLPTDE